MKKRRNFRATIEANLTAKLLREGELPVIVYVSMHGRKYVGLSPVMGVDIRVRSSLKGWECEYSENGDFFWFNALKDVYLPGIKQMLNSSSVLLNQIEKETN